MQQQGDHHPDVTFMTVYDDGCRETKLQVSSFVTSYGKKAFVAASTTRVNDVPETDVPRWVSRETITKAILEIGAEFLEKGVFLALSDGQDAPQHGREASILWHTEPEFHAVAETYKGQSETKVFKLTEVHALSVRGRRCDVSFFVVSNLHEPPRASAYLFSWALCGKQLSAADHATLAYAPSRPPTGAAAT